MNLHSTPQAHADLLEIRRYVSSELHNATAAQRIARAILASCSNLKCFPQMGFQGHPFGAIFSRLSAEDTDTQAAVYNIPEAVRPPQDELLFYRVLFLREDLLPQNPLRKRHFLLETT